MIKRIRQLTQLVSFRDIRNVILGMSIVFGGLALAALTLYASRTGNVRLGGIAASASLAFVILIIIFVIPPLARSASAEVSQLNLPFEFTTGGAVFIGLIVIVAFAAWNTGNNLLFLVLSFTTSALIIGFLVGTICLRKLDVKMRFPETIYAGVKTPILVELSNRKQLFPTFSVTAEVRGKDREHSRFIDDFKKIVSEKWAKRLAAPPILKHTLEHFVYAPRSGSIENNVKHVFKIRGRFIIQDFELSTRFPFGFFRHRRRLPAQRAEIIVFPRVEEIHQDIFDLPLDAGRLTSSKRGLGQDLFALREYQVTDDIRHVDWNATARSNHLTVRQFAAEDEKLVTVILDSYIEPTQKERKMTLRKKISIEQTRKKLSLSEKRFELGVSKAASLISHFENQRAETCLVINMESEGFGSGQQHLNKSLKRLALAELSHKKRVLNEYLESIFTNLPENRIDSHVFFVTAINESVIPAEILRRVHVINYYPETKSLS